MNTIPSKTKLIFLPWTRPNYVKRTTLRFPSQANTDPLEAILRGLLLLCLLVSLWLGAVRIGGSTAGVKAAPAASAVAERAPGDNRQPGRLSRI